MKNIDLALLKHSELFHGIEEGEISSMLACLSAERKAMNGARMCCGTASGPTPWA